MNKKYVGIRFLSKKPLKPEGLGKEIFEYLFKTYPEIQPEYTNYYEPLNIPITDVSVALNYWWSDTFYGRKRTSPQGDWSAGMDVGKNSRLRIDHTWKKTIPWHQIFIDIYDLLEPYFCYVHLFTPHEGDVLYSRAAYVTNRFYNSLIGLEVAKKGIHDLGWCNGFGGHYLDIMPPVSALEKAGVQVIPRGAGVMLQFSDKITDVMENFEDFDRRRTAVKALFPKGTFEPYIDRPNIGYRTIKELEENS